MKMGQAVSMLVFTSVVAAFTTGSGQTSTVEPFGYRLTAIIATVFCIIGAVLFFFYDEKRRDEKDCGKRKIRMPEKSFLTLFSPTVRTRRSEKRRRRKRFSLYDLPEHRNKDRKRHGLSAV